MPRTITRIASIAAALAAAATPAAQAAHGPGNAPSTDSSVAELQDARLGPKYITVPSTPTGQQQPTAVVTVGAPNGFDWHDAAIGAGATALALVTAAGTTVVVSRHRHGPPPLAHA